MRLILTNGYPYPLPADFDAGKHDAMAHTLELSGVVHFKQKHETTIEFKDYEAALRAQERTGWEFFGYPYRAILSAPTSADYGYAYAALIAGDMAYAGHILTCRVE